MGARDGAQYRPQRIVQATRGADPHSYAAPCNRHPLRRRNSLSPQGGRRTTTRDLMRQMETDLGTKLDWIAVDHHNTGHPHTHIAPPSTLSGRALPSTVSAAIPRPSFAPTSARWKRCPAPVMPSGSTPARLPPFMQDGQPMLLTKDELRVAAMRQLNGSNSSFDFAWIKAIEETGRHGWHEPLRRRRRTKS